MKYILAILLTMGVLNFANNANALLFNGHNYEFIKFAEKKIGTSLIHFLKLKAAASIKLMLAVTGPLRYLCMSR